MADNRFKNFPTDARFTSPGSDVRFATPGTDARFGASDTRFEGATYGGGGGGLPTGQVTVADLQAQASGTGNVPIQLTGEDDTYNWILTATDPGTSPPSLAQVNAGQDHTGSAAAASGSVTTTGLTPVNLTLPAGLSGNYYFVIADVDSIVFDATAQAIDTTAPTLSSATGTQTGPTTASWGVTSNDATGTIYAGVRVSTDAAITAAQLIAGSGGTGVAFDNDATPTADANNGGSFTGLTAETTYIVDTVHVDEYGNNSAVASSSSFSTPAVPSAVSQVGTLAALSSSTPAGTYTGSTYTPSGGTNNLVAIVVIGVGGGATLDMTQTKIYWGATEITANKQTVSFDDGGGGYVYAAIAWVRNPAASATAPRAEFYRSDGTTVNFINACTIHVVELDGVNATTETGGTGSNSGTNGYFDDCSITTTSGGDGYILSAGMIVYRADAGTLPLVPNTGFTELFAGETGTGVGADFHYNVNEYVGPADATYTAGSAGAGDNFEPSCAIAVEFMPV